MSSSRGHRLEATRAVRRDALPCPAHYVSSGRRSLLLSFPAPGRRHRTGTPATPRRFPSSTADPPARSRLCNPSHQRPRLRGEHAGGSTPGVRALSLVMMVGSPGPTADGEDSGGFSPSTVCVRVRGILNASCVQGVCEAPCVRRAWVLRLVTASGQLLAPLNPNP